MRLLQRLCRFCSVAGEIFLICNGQPVPDSINEVEATVIGKSSGWFGHYIALDTPHGPIEARTTWAAMCKHEIGDKIDVQVGFTVNGWEVV